MYWDKITGYTYICIFFTNHTQNTMENCNSTVALKNEETCNNSNQNLNKKQDENIDKCTKWLLEKCTLNTVNSDIEFNSHVFAESLTSDDQSVFSESSENILLQFEKNAVSTEFNIYFRG